MHTLKKKEISHISIISNTSTYSQGAIQIFSTFFFQLFIQQGVISREVDFHSNAYASQTFCTCLNIFLFSFFSEFPKFNRFKIDMCTIINES
jgi:hypothetical protein